MNPEVVQLTLQVWKVDQDAVIPSKASNSDVGLDLTIIKKHKDVRNNVVMYDTGIKVQPPDGYYIEIVPRSSIVKSGWMLANSVGIIDSTYTGNLYVALARVDPNASEPTLPYKGFQLILRKQVFPTVNVVQDISALPVTKRGDGGFGSTN